MSKKATGKNIAILLVSFFFVVALPVAAVAGLAAPAWVLGRPGIAEDLLGTAGGRFWFVCVVLLFQASLGVLLSCSGIGGS